MQPSLSPRTLENFTHQPHQTRIVYVAQQVGHFFTTHVATRVYRVTTSVHPIGTYIT